jgi:hypothetical protein
MANVDRAFRVIVLGGIALVAVPTGACGGQTKSSAADAGSGADASFPDEGIAPAPDSGFPQEGPYDPDGFPSETAQIIDSGFAPDSFPTEGPAMIIDSGSGDAGVDAFPQETAQAADK